MMTTSRIDDVRRVNVLWWVIDREGTSFVS